MDAELPTSQEAQAAKPSTRPKDPNGSGDGAWRSFPAVPNLLLYVSTGAFYGRVKVGGKIIRRKLNTTVFTTAKLRLLDFLKKERTETPSSEKPPTFKAARELYEADLKADPTYAARTKSYKQFNLRVIQKSWPGLDALTLDTISEADCVKWSGRLADAVSAEAYNHTLGVFRDIFARGMRDYQSKGGKEIPDPSRLIKRLGVKPKRLQLPEPAEFHQLVETIASAGGRFSKDAADLVEFLAYSGCRIGGSPHIFVIEPGCRFQPESRLVLRWSLSRCCFARWSAWTPRLC